MSKSLLIIFAKNPGLGKVKTRIAAALGNEKALAIYHILLTHTIEVTRDLNIDKTVVYSDYVDSEDKWENDIYSKDIQRGNNLGERMHNAFLAGFAKGYQHICIIGTDNLEITPGIIDRAFFDLKNHDLVVGPAKDGGYYLLGMKKMYSALFQNKKWSTSSVLKDTLQDTAALKLSVAQLPLLNDVDTKEDWDRSMR